MSTDYSSMKVDDLKVELKKRGLPSAGLREELIERLNKFPLASNKEDKKEEEEDNEPQNKKQKISSKEESPQKEKKQSTLGFVSTKKVEDGKTLSEESKIALPAESGLLKQLSDESWRKELSSIFNKPYFKSILEFLSKEKKKGAEIFPPENEIFNAFNWTPFDKIKVVILGQDPYHDNNQAHGLCFSVKKGITPPPSLKNIYKELSTDIPGFKIPKHGNLENWAREGVFLLNATLTVQAHLANSHKDCGWMKFTDDVIQCISQKRKGIVFILWGGFAQKKASLIDGKKHHIIKAAHPSPLSCTKFFGCKVFSKTNEFLEKENLGEINWNLPEVI